MAYMQPRTGYHLLPEATTDLPFIPLKTMWSTVSPTLPTPNRAIKMAQGPLLLAVNWHLISIAPSYTLFTTTDPPPVPLITM